MKIVLIVLGIVLAVLSLVGYVWYRIFRSMTIPSPLYEE